MLAVAMFGIGLGAVLMAWEGITSGANQKALQDAGVGALVGGVAGIVGGFVANQVFDLVG